MGSRVLIDAQDDKYDGVYLAADKGGLIKGKRVDIFVESYEEAIQFGRQTVMVSILGRGED